MDVENEGEGGELRGEANGVTPCSFKAISERAKYNRAGDSSAGF
jgi:hypothetical protein